MNRLLLRSVTDLSSPPRKRRSYFFISNLAPTLINRYLTEAAWTSFGRKDTFWIPWENNWLARLRVLVCERLQVCLRTDAHKGLHKNDTKITCSSECALRSSAIEVYIVFYKRWRHAEKEISVPLLFVTDESRLWNLATVNEGSVQTEVAGVLNRIWTTDHAMDRGGSLEETVEATAISANCRRKIRGNVNAFAAILFVIAQWIIWTEKKCASPLDSKMFFFRLSPKCLLTSKCYIFVSHTSNIFPASAPLRP